MISAVEPLGTLWINAIRMTVIPLVVSLLFVGIASAVDLRSIGRVGGRAFLLFLLFLGGAATFTALVAPSLFRRLPLDAQSTASLRTGVPGQPQAAVELPPFSDWLTGLVPTNPIRAAAEGEVLPLILFVVLFALATTRIAPDLRQILVGFFRATGDAMLVLVRWILALAPIGVFALSLGLAIRLGTSAAGAIGYYVLVFSALLFLSTLALYPIAVLLGGVSLREFARATLPAQVVAFSSRSSLASLPAMVEGAEARLGLSSRVTGFVLPLAVSTFKLNSAFGGLIGASFVARLYGIELGVGQIALLAIAGVAMSFYSPGVPSGGLLLMAPLYLAVGLPVEGLGILIAVDMIPDIFKTVLNVTADMTVATILARAEIEGEVLSPLPPIADVGAPAAVS